MPEHGNPDPWLSGEPEEHFSEAELQAARETFEELRRIHDEEGITRQFVEPDAPPPIPEADEREEQDEFEGAPMVGFVADTSMMSEAEIFRGLCRLFGDDPEEVIEEIKREDADGEEWLRDRGIE